MHRGASLAAVCGVDLAVLLCDRPAFGELMRGFIAPHAWVRDAGPDHALVVLAGAAAWLTAIWLACGLAALGAAQLPGAVGRAGRLTSSRLLPATLRSVLVGSAGLGILVAPLAAGATTHRTSADAPLAVAALPAPSWPVDPPSRTTSAPPPRTTSPPPSRTTSPPPARPTSLPPPAWPATPTGHPAARPTPAARDEVRVRPGDSLWLIAARRLGAGAPQARIADEWPRWYAANRQGIGADPGLIRPGEVLRAPDGRR